MKMMEMTIKILTSEHNVAETLQRIADAFVKPGDRDEPKKKQKEPTNIVKQPFEVHTMLLGNGEPAKPEKKPRTKEEQDAIDSIKKAYFEKKAEKGTRNKRKDIDNAAIVEMRDEKGMKFATIAKELGCCEQTVINRYNKAKNGGKK